MMRVSVGPKVPSSICIAVKETYIAFRGYFGHFRQGISTLSATVGKSGLPNPESAYGVRVRARIHERLLLQHTTYILSVVAGKTAKFAKVTS